jgi:hypothetical protein
VTAPMIGMINDPAEGGADDHTDGQIDDIAAHGKFFELFEHFSLPPPISAKPIPAMHTPKGAKP